MFVLTVAPESMDTGTPTAEENSDDLYMDLSVNSVVEVTLANGNAYGIIRWIGNLPDREEMMAGLELVMCLLSLVILFSGVSAMKICTFIVVLFI